MLKSLRKKCKQCVRRLCAIAQARAAASGGLAPKAKAAQADFVFRVLMQTTKSMPPSVQRVVLQLDDGGEVVSSGLRSFGGVEAMVGGLMRMSCLGVVGAVVAQSSSSGRQWSPAEWAQ